MVDMIKAEVSEDRTHSDREVTLPSGAIASIRCGTGRDLRIAQMAVGQQFDPWKFEFALAAQVSIVAGKRLTMEQIDAMPIADVLALQAEVNRVNFPTATPSAEEAP